MIRVAGAVGTVVAKFSVSIPVLAAAGFMGLPVDNPWFDVLVAYVFGQWALRSTVNGMPEPEEDSSLWYIWCYRTMHSMAHISTAYFSHRNMWKYISGAREGGE
jgi:hypothetical protein